MEQTKRKPPFKQNKNEHRTTLRYTKAIHLKNSRANLKTVQQAQELNPYYNQLNPS